MSTTEEIDRYILKKYEVHQRLGKGVRSPWHEPLRLILEAEVCAVPHSLMSRFARYQSFRLSLQSTLGRGIHALLMTCTTLVLKAMYELSSEACR